MLKAIYVILLLYNELQDLPYIVSALYKNKPYIRALKKLTLYIITSVTLRYIIILYADHSELYSRQ